MRLLAGLFFLGGGFLLDWLLFCLHSSLFLLKFSYTSFSIEQLLLTGKQGMAGRADIYVDFVLGRADRMACSTGANRNGIKVFWMDFFSHNVPILSQALGFVHGGRRQ